MASRLDLEDAVKKALSDYGADCTELMSEVITEVSKESAKKLRKDSPKKTGKYAKGWKSSVDKKRLTVGAVIYNKDRYQLTHLLEKGHAKRGGGRVAAKEHIAPVNDWAVDEVQDRIIKSLERGAR